MFLAEIILLSSYMFVHPLMLIFSDDPTSLNNSDFHLVTNFWIRKVQTKSQYYKIFMAQSIAASLSLLCLVTFSIMVSIFGHEFYVAVVFLGGPF